MKVRIATLTLCMTATTFADRIIPATPDELTAKVEQAFTNADIEIAEIIAVPTNQRTFQNTLGALEF